MVLTALADRTRLESSASAGRRGWRLHIHESLGIPQPKASRHLAYLRLAGVVAAQKVALVHYRLASSTIGDAAVLDSVAPQWCISAPPNATCLGSPAGSISISRAIRHRSCCATPNAQSQLPSQRPGDRSHVVVKAPGFYLASQPCPLELMVGLALEVVTNPH